MQLKVVKTVLPYKVIMTSYQSRRGGREATWVLYEQTLPKDILQTMLLLLIPIFVQFASYMIHSLNLVKL